MDLRIDAEKGTVSLRLQSALYPREAVEGAAHAFAARADAYAEDEPDGLRLTLEAKAPGDAAALRRLAGDFLNEALSQALHLRLLAENRALNEYVLTKAFLSARRDPADPLQPKAADELGEEQRREADRLEAQAETRREAAR